jgi:two-component system, OmpR family, sensor histidine kinase KdpD
MLDEGRRRSARGADVVVGAWSHPPRGGIRALMTDLEAIGHGQVDVAALLARMPQVVLIDELGGAQHSGPPRHELVEVLLAAGLDVVTTLDMGEIESMCDLVEQVSGHRSTAVVPDAVVRRADQVELVDMSPEALRRRLAHGHVYSAEEMDAAVANRFRPMVLAQLRQLSFRWMAERAEEQIERQLAIGRGPAGVVDGRPRRERVLVALGGEGGGVLVRRAARLAGRHGADLVGVHVVIPGRSPGPDLELQRRLLAELGGSYREVMGDDVVSALSAFARVEGATQVVIGGRPGAEVSRPQPVVDGLLADVGAFDVHVVATGASVTAATGAWSSPRGRRVEMPHRRAGWIVCLVGLPMVTLAMSAFRGHISVGSALLVDLCVVMTAAALGGLAAGLVASVGAFALTNWFLTPPLHTLTVNESENVVALSVFVIVTVVVSVLVDRGARRSREATVARTEAAALARSAATLVGAHDPLPELLEQLRATFGLRSAAVFEHGTNGWWPTQQSGDSLLGPEDATRIDLSADGRLRLVVDGDAMRPEQLDVLRAFADQLAMAVEARRLRVDAANADLIAQADALRSSLLRAVSHDFRTPLATIKASASGLQHPGVEFSEKDRGQLLAEIEAAADRLERMVRDLLDMSRLEAGALELALTPVALEEVVAAALGTVGSIERQVEVDVSESLPLVLADRALLERALANVVSNAMAWSPDGMPVRVQAAYVSGMVDLRVVDRGPGIAAVDRDRIFVPFQRLGDRSHDAGAGLGLAIAHGFVEAMGGTIETDDTAGGGLTMSIVLAVAAEETR